MFIVNLFFSQTPPLTYRKRAHEVVQNHHNMSRRSIHNSTSSIKQRQLSHLNAQLAQLQANLTDLDNLIKITAIQAEYIEKIGLMHGSLFMASHDVFERESFAGASFAETVQDQDEEQELDSKDS